MSLDIFWFLPTSGDTRYLGTSDFGRAPTNEYLRQIAVTSETLGYDGLLIPTGSSCQDPWVVAASLVPVTHRIKLLVALRTSLGGPAPFARQTATLDQALNGRLLLNVVPGGDATELAAPPPRPISIAGPPSTMTASPGDSMRLATIGRSIAPMPPASMIGLS